MASRIQQALSQQPRTIPSTHSATLLTHALSFTIANGHEPKNSQDPVHVISGWSYLISSIPSRSRERLDPGDIYIRLGLPNYSSIPCNSTYGNGVRDRGKSSIANLWRAHVYFCTVAARCTACIMQRDRHPCLSDLIRLFVRRPARRNMYSVARLGSSLLFPIQ